MDSATEARFRAKIDQTGDCWNWTAGLSMGYGSFAVEGKAQSAHRLAYKLWVGPIPEGLHIDHLCRNRACVNPAHLEPVTQAENNRRAGAAKTHCPRNHPYSGDNLKIRRGARQCRECARIKIREYTQRRLSEGWTRTAAGWVRPQEVAQ